MEGEKLYRWMLNEFGDKNKNIHLIYLICVIRRVRLSLWELPEIGERLGAVGPF